jgi:hypothetical protein
LAFVEVRCGLVSLLRFDGAVGGIGSSDDEFHAPPEIEVALLHEFGSIVTRGAKFDDDVWRNGGVVNSCSNGRRLSANVCSHDKLTG